MEQVKNYFNSGGIFIVFTHDNLNGGRDTVALSKEKYNGEYLKILIDGPCHEEQEIGKEDGELVKQYKIPVLEEYRWMDALVKPEYMSAGIDTRTIFRPHPKQEGPVKAMYSHRDPSEVATLPELKPTETVEEAATDK